MLFKCKDWSWVPALVTVQKILVRRGKDRNHFQALKNWAWKFSHRGQKIQSVTFWADLICVFCLRCQRLCYPPTRSLPCGDGNSVGRKEANDPHGPSEIILGSKSLKHLDVTALRPTDRHNFLHFQCTVGCSYSLLSAQPFQCFALYSSLLLFQTHAPRLLTISEASFSRWPKTLRCSEHLSNPSYLRFYPSASPARQGTQVRDSPEAKQSPECPRRRLMSQPPGCAGYRVLTGTSLAPPKVSNSTEWRPVSEATLQFQGKSWNSQNLNNREQKYF